MSYIKSIPRKAGELLLGGLKVGDLVKTTRVDFSQEKGGFETKPIRVGTIGRVKKIFDFGPTQKGDRFLVDVKFEDHPITNFYSQELKKVRI